jgi:hypothetical protein
MPDEGSVISKLSALTASVMAEKKVAAKTLTPLAAERPVLPDDVGVLLSNEALYDHAKTLRRFAADALAIADGLDELTNKRSEKVDVIDIDVARKEKEAAADFNADFKAKQKQAQSSTFEWVCPVHQKATTKKSPAGREFLGCPECNQFKR